MKRGFFVLLTVVLLAGLIGCDAIQKKFTRKNKPTVKIPRFYQLKKYTRKPSPELYKQHFAYWESWQSELIQFLGQNHKKDVRAMEEALGHLKDMQSILIPSKADDIQPHVEKMEEAKEIVLRGDLTFATQDYVRGVLDREDRAIKREFCYNKVKNDLRKNFDDEEAPKLTMAPGKEVSVEGQK